MKTPHNTLNITSLEDVRHVLRCSGQQTRRAGPAQIPRPQKKQRLPIQLQPHGIAHGDNAPIAHQHIGIGLANTFFRPCHRHHFDGAVERRQRK